MGALFRHLDQRLLPDAGDRQVNRRESREVRLPGAECVHHPERGKVVLQLAFVLHPEARKKEFHLGLLEAPGDVTPRRCVERRNDVINRHAISRNEHRHRKRAAAVRQVHGLETTGLEVREVPQNRHERDRPGGSIFGVEGLGSGVVRIELEGPGGLEVDRVDQIHEDPRGNRGGNDLLDMTARR